MQTSGTEGCVAWTLGVILWTSRGNTSPTPFPLMKAIFVYVAISAIAVNIAGNLMSKTAESLQQQRTDRIEKICAINPAYCG